MLSTVIFFFFIKPKFVLSWHECIRRGHAYIVERENSQGKCYSVYPVLKYKVLLGYRMEL